MTETACPPAPAVWHQGSIADPATYCAEQARQVLQALSDGTYCWFADGQLNTCYLALAHLIECGRGEQPAPTVASRSRGQCRHAG